MMGLVFLASACSHDKQETRDRALELRFLGDFNFAEGTPLDHVEPPEFGGISGIGYDSKNDKLTALSDARFDCRFYELELELDGDPLRFMPLSVTFLRDKEGERLPPRAMDAEGLALMSDGSILVSSEGDVGRGIAPGLFLFGSDGRMKKQFPVPAKFLGSTGDNAAEGVRDNLAFESLDVSPDGTRLFFAAEGALVQDGEITSSERGSRTRIVEYALEGNEVSPMREFAYDVDPVSVPSDFGPGVGGNGLVELVSLGGRELLALERSFFVEGSEILESSDILEGRRSHQKIRIYHVSLRDASDVSGLASLKEAGDIKPASKRLLLDLEDIVGQLHPDFPTLDNFEGMCFGPKLSNGNRSLILVSDNNFQPWQRTAFLVFELIEP
jgi:hypothetical protein